MRKPEILYEDQDIIVCRKQAGVAVQSARLGTPDMVSMLKTFLRERDDLPEIPQIYVVHRLDQPVQGLIVFARNQASAASLSAQAADGRMEKQYLARVCGIEQKKTSVGTQGVESVVAGSAGGGREDGRKPAETTLTDWLVRDGRTNCSRIARPGEKGARKAVLTYRILHDDLLQIRLQTGRHHQIRVQLAAAGMPLLGDRKYGGQTAVRQVARQNMGRTTGQEEGASGSRNCTALQYPALCAASLSFVHPRTGKRLHFTLSEDEIIFA